MDIMMFHFCILNNIMNKSLIVIFLLATLILLGCYKFDYTQNNQNNPAKASALAKYLYREGAFNEIKFNEEHKDKYIYIVGYAGHINSVGEVEFSIHNSLLGKRLVCKFIELDKLNNLRYLEKILVYGKVSHIINKDSDFTANKQHVYFENCELLEHIADN